MHTKNGFVCPSWDEYRRRSRAYWLTFFSFPLWVVPIAGIQRVLALGGMNPALGFFLTGGLALVSFGIIQTRLVLCPCPGCGRSFHCTWLYGSLFNRRCVHCGLPKWTPGGGEKAPLGRKLEDEALRDCLWDRELDR